MSYVSKEINPFHEFLRGQDLDKYDINEEKDQMGLFLFGYRMVYLQPDISGTSDTITYHKQPADSGH